MEYNQTTALTNAPSRKIFAPLFKARWQNMQNIVNDSAFMSMIPEPYLTYYNAFIRQCLQWSRGYVPALHKRDFFSTGMGYTVCDIISTECLSGGYRIESKERETQEFFEKYEDMVHFTNELYRMFFFTAAGGNALMVLTPVDGDLYLTAYPADRFIFEISRNEKVTNCLILNRFTAGDNDYYAREKRQVLNGRGYYKVEIAQSTLATSPNWSTDKLKYIPECIKEGFKNVYGNIDINTWYELPAMISGCGAYNIKNKPLAVALADMPGYSDSSLYTALDVLYSIDYNYTQSQVDMYMGKARALIPKQMSAGIVSMGRADVVEGKSYSECFQQAELNEDFYTQVMSPSGEAIKPTFIQADLRAEAHKYIRDADLELLASKVGLSSSTLANHLTYNTAKTATEVNTEQDTTAETVKRKRDLAKVPLDRLLTDIAAFYGLKGEVAITWGRTGVNSARENAELLADYNAGTLPLEQYLKKRWADLSEEEVKQWVQEIKIEQAEKRKNENFGASMFDDKDYFGDGDINENSERAK